VRGEVGMMFQAFTKPIEFREWHRYEKKRLLRAHCSDALVLEYYQAYNPIQLVESCPQYVEPGIKYGTLCA